MLCCYLPVALLACLLLVLSTQVHFGFCSAIERCLQLCKTHCPVQISSILHCFCHQYFSLDSLLCSHWNLLRMSFILYQDHSLCSDVNLMYKMLSYPVFITSAFFSFLRIILGRSHLPEFVAILLLNVICLYLDISGFVYPLLFPFLNHYVQKDWKNPRKI